MFRKLKLIGYTRVQRIFSSFLDFFVLIGPTCRTEFRGTGGGPWRALKILQGSYEDELANQLQLSPFKDHARDNED